MLCRLVLSAAFMLGAAFLSALAPPASAQYMYLDANGDGVHTEADVLTTTGVSSVDVWIVTNQNRDGTAAACAVEFSSAMTINSYEIILRAEGGTLTYGAFQNAIPEFSTSFGARSDETDAYFGVGGGGSKPAGRYRLARVSVAVVSGAPSVSIATSSHLEAISETAFGCQCPGVDQDNTMKLGSDWQDADGLPFSGMPMPFAPTFTGTPGYWYLDEGTAGSLSIGATDADSDSLILTVEGLPGFASLTTTASSRGQVTGRIDATPGFSTAGRYLLRAVCDDGVLQAAKSIDFRVRDVNKAPSFDPIQEVRVIAGTVAEREIVARDAESEPLTIRIAYAPSFVTLGPAETEAGAYRAIARIAPGLSDIGEAHVGLLASDGIMEAGGFFRVRVGSEGSFKPMEIDSIPDFTMAEGETIRHEVVVHNPYGNHYFVSFLDEPNFVDVEWGIPSPPPTITITPGPHDAGEFDVTVTADESYSYDGFALPASRRFHVSVVNRQFPPQVQTTPAYPCVQQGEVYSLLLRVSDPDGDPFTATFGAPPPWATSSLESPTSCRYVLSPTSENSPGVVDLMVRTVDGAGAMNETVVPVMLALVGQCPRGGGWASGPNVSHLIADAGGPYAGVAGARIRFDGSATVDPAGTLLFYEWTFGDGTSGLGRALGHAYPEGGTYRAVLAARVSEAPSIAAFDTVTIAIQDALPARAFQSAEETPLVLRAARSQVLLRMERVGEEYALEDLDPASLCLWSPGHGEVDSIFAQGAKAAKIEDRDRNGVPDLAVAFAKEDLRRLFANVRGKHSLPARLQGRLPNGARVRGSLDLEILGAPAKGVAVWPNPMNPRGVIAFEAKRPGHAVVRLYDVSGRLVRTLLDGRVEMGDVHVPIDGLDEHGRDLSSGVYFYQVTTVDGVWRGRATILK